MSHILTDVAGRHALLEGSYCWLPIEEAEEDIRGVLLFRTEEEAQRVARRLLGQGIHARPRLAPGPR
jgi:hypothetical protein